MQMSGEQRIAAPRERVWAALNDPEVLRRSIPGCQSLDKESDTAMRAVVEVKIGPIGAKFNGAVTLADIKAPESYTITGQGQGGTVGSAKGGAKVRLTPDGQATLLGYEVEAEVGGRLAQLGGPIIDATAKQLAAKFFRQFGAEVEGVAQPVTAAEAAATAAIAPVVTPQTTPVPPQLSPAATGRPFAGAPWAWIAALALALVTGAALTQAGDNWLVSVIVLVMVATAAGYEAGRRGGRP